MNLFGALRAARGISRQELARRLKLPRLNVDRVELRPLGQARSTTSRSTFAVSVAASTWYGRCHRHGAATGLRDCGRPQPHVHDLKALTGWPSTYCNQGSPWATQGDLHCRRNLVPNLLPHGRPWLFRLAFAELARLQMRVRCISELGLVHDDQFVGLWWRIGLRSWRSENPWKPAESGRSNSDSVLVPTSQSVPCTGKFAAVDRAFGKLNCRGIHRIIGQRPSGDKTTMQQLVVIERRFAFLLRQRPL